MFQPEGGFYAWVNIAATGCSSMEFADRLLHAQHLAMVPGSAFGPDGEGYLRITCVKSWQDLKEGLKRIRRSTFLDKTIL